MIKALDTPGPGLPLSASFAGSDASGGFDATLQRAQAARSREEIRDAAEELVAAAFIVPLLRQVRESSQAQPPFAPTQAEKQFGQFLDRITAKNIVAKSDLPIVGRLVDSFEQANARRSAPNPGVLA